MLTTAKLIEAAKKAQGLASNGRLALVLGVPDKTVQRWNTGKNQPDDVNAVRLAALADLDPAEVLAALAAERATGESRKVWETVAKRSRAAVVALMAVILSMFAGGGPNGGALAAQVDRPALHAFSADPSVYYVYCARWLEKLLGRLSWWLFAPFPRFA